LRHRPHSTHFSVKEAIGTAERIGARRTIFTHMTHEVDHDDPLSPGVEFGYDGLTFDAE
jgi:phosphoribosyl 1,2-cyclic phosphate phosphodiesterase